MSDPAKLVHMANQIAAFFASQRGDPAEQIAAHLRAFWTPAMRQALIEHCQAGGEGLSAPALTAALRLADGAS